MCYVPHRDDFFALASQEYYFVAGLTDRFEEVAPDLSEAISTLARVGIAETRSPEVLETSYCGPSFIGEFPELPSVIDPLVVNCFSTAHCPLKCLYCHADDLMTGALRESEVDDDLANVLSTANAIRSMVGVITGGDPLTRPERARRLIEGLTGSKALVLDTSGVGPIESLIGVLKEHAVHVRVSLDSVNPTENSKIRPRNLLYGGGVNASLDGATRTIEACLRAAIPVTVQTVVSNFNDHADVWRDLRDWLVAMGVKHWVLHAAVAGGKARSYDAARRSDKRPLSLLPSATVYERLWGFVKQTVDDGVPLDIRCTDTEQSPNSVLLIGSNGDLFTEGYAKRGKVLLFGAGAGRPDSVNKLMLHVDRFGHARRYLNWNKWFFDGKSIEELGLRLPLPHAQSTNPDRLVENELKCRVGDIAAAWSRLESSRFKRSAEVLQRDEYFDTSQGSLQRVDWVVRLRSEGTASFFAVKGQRFYGPDGSNARLEIEVPIGQAGDVRRALEASGFRRTWFFEKKRTIFRSKEVDVVVAFDQVPNLGWFVELEGARGEISKVIQIIGNSLGRSERGNYKELYVANHIRLGGDASTLAGASFDESQQRGRAKRGKPGARSRPAKNVAGRKS
jgi:predicted adenylyl cyclase CyaB